MRVVVAVVFGAAAASAGAQQMPVSTFLSKADALESKGPMAFFSGDLKLLKNEVSRSAAELRAERTAALKSGKAATYCPPERASSDPMNWCEAFAQSLPPNGPASAPRKASGA